MTLPVPDPRTWSVGDLAAASGSINLNTEIRDVVNFLAGRPLFVAHQTVAQSIASSPSPFVAITFTAEEVDTYNGHSTSTNTSRYTAQVAGWYHVLGLINWASNATGRRLAQLWVNGVGTGTEARQTEAAANTNGGPTTNVIEAPLYLNVNDYVELAGFQSSGAALNTQIGTGNVSNSMLCALWIHD